MWRFALRQIAYERFRSALTILAIAGAVVMILVLRGFEQGLYLQSKKVVLDRGGQLILTQAGVANFLAVRSSLPQLTREQVENVAGVRTAHPITGFWVIYGPEGNTFPLLMLVYDTLGGPTHLVEGHPITNSREIVIDKGFSKRFGLKPGDPVVISDFEFRVAGITSGSSALFSTFAFVTYDGMIDLFLESEIAPDISTFPLLSFLLVELDDGVSASEVAERIEEQVPVVDVFTPQRLAQQDMQLGEDLFGPIMGVLVSLSYVIGIMVVGMIIYSDVSGRRRTFGIMKALGFRLSRIGYGVVAQALVLVLIACPIGLALAVAVGSAIEWKMPVYTVYVLDTIGLLRTFAGIMLVTLIGALAPLRLIARVDPVEAFQAE